MTKYLHGKKILVTGACGTVGKELVRQLLKTENVSELVGIDNNESELFFLEQQFQNHSNAKFYLADVRDKEKISRKMIGIDIVFHTAAYKHVIVCERSPFEAVRTNIIGVQNVITSAIDNNVEKVVFTSSDKAVNPTNVMGTSKLMGERLMSAASTNLKGVKPIFASTRFGNVLGSRGSVIPLFREQIRQGGPVTLTDEKMTRFIMSITQAVRLVLDSSELARGGEVFITKMPVIRVKDLAEVMIDSLAASFGHKPENIGIKIIGSKPGEKMYEELMNIEETRRTIELKDYFVAMPALTSLYKNIEYNYPDVITDRTKMPYNSDTQPYMSKDELYDFLVVNDLLHDPVNKIYVPK